MHLSFVVPSGLFLLGLIIRAAYELRKNANRIDLESKPLFAAIFTTMCVMWISWFSLCPEDPHRMQFSPPIHLAGLSLTCVGFILAVGALIQLKGVENIDHLVTKGLFKKIRHPMYFGFLLWIVGWSLFFGSVYGFAVGLPGIVSVLWWRHLEEKRLEVQFGDAFLLYKNTTWF